MLLDNAQTRPYYLSRRNEFSLSCTPQLSKDWDPELSLCRSHVYLTYRKHPALENLQVGALAGFARQRCRTPDCDPGTVPQFHRQPRPNLEILVCIHHVLTQ